jgi:hypothetical protein
LLGYFIIPVAVRGRVNSETSLLGAVKGAGSAMTGALANSQLPFQEVVREAGASWLPGINPIFQVRRQGKTSSKAT